MALDKVKDDMLQDNLVFPGSTTQFPSITTTQRDALSSVQPGTLIYNSTVGKLQQYDSNNQWATIDSPPVITSVTYPTESGAVLTALDASGSSDAAQTLIINGSNFSSTSQISVQISVSGNFVAFASSISVNSGRTQITCTGVTKRAAADDYTLKVTNVGGLSATTTVNFSADPSFSTAADLGTAYAGLTLNKPIAFTGTKVIQGATAKPTWMTVTGNTSTADNGASDTTFDATGSPATLGGTIAAPASGNSQNHTFSIIVRDAENQTFNRDFSLTATNLPAETGVAQAITGASYRYYVWTATSGTLNFTPYSTNSIEYLVIGGGGGGGSLYYSGGGGAGGVRTGSFTPTADTTYTVTVGDGGAGGSSGSTQPGGNGGSSTISGSGLTTITAYGGAGGNGSQGGQNNAPTSANYGSGGGGSQAGAGTDGTNGSGTFGSATFQGYDGGDGHITGAGNARGTTGGGGGGAGGNGLGGSNMSRTVAADGGVGISTFSSWIAEIVTAGGTARGQNISGTYWFAGGGAGGSYGHLNDVYPQGGNGGGGRGATSESTNAGNAGNGTDGTGGGGGGGDAHHSSAAGAGGTGGSGIVIVRFPL